ncbi:MAG: GntR family transcriptional regulator [Pelagibacterium sp. SCN 63-23]|nr:MAG: GntR family transcriptional regulator [Pelagibacterium sp. SCN 63-23]
MTEEPNGLVRPDRRRPEPLWHQAEMVLRDLIGQGEWAPGTQIPTEDRLCDMLGISRITVRHALRNLEEAGMLRREHGRGTFVRSATMVAGVRGLTSFTDEMQTLSVSPGTRLLAARLIAAAGAVAEALEIGEGDEVVQLRRLRLGNGQPIGIQTTHLPSARAPGLFAVAADVASLYRWLKDNAGIVPVMAKEVYRVGAVGAGDAEDLQLPVGTPAFEVERITFDARGPFEFAVSTMRADRYEIRSTLHV